MGPAHPVFVDGMGMVFMVEILDGASETLILS